VTVLVGVLVAVLVGVKVAVLVGVLVGVFVGVLVAVLVGVLVGVLVAVLVGVLVDIAVGETQKAESLAISVEISFFILTVRLPYKPLIVSVNVALVVPAAVNLKLPLVRKVEF